MSVAAVVLVKDEGDIIEHTIRHLATQVDHVIASDNLSSDGTSEILAGLQVEGLPLTILPDDQVGYFQSAKTTWLAARALERGFDWVLPVDADEMWVTLDGRPIRDHLLSLAPDVQAVTAELYHYLPTVEDPEDENPFRRIGWRLAAPSGLPKMGARTSPGLVIDAGNHGVEIDGHRPRLVSGGLRVNHYSWRSSEQYARKVRNGARAYAATDLPESVGPHWRMWGDPEAEDLEERAADHFRRHFFATNPPCAPGSSDPNGLVYDPALT